MRMSLFWKPAVALGLALACAGIAGNGVALANDKLVELSKSEENWPITGKTYGATNYSKATQISAENVQPSSAFRDWNDSWVPSKDQ